jgi:flagellar FliL protein
MAQEASAEPSPQGSSAKGGKAWLAMLAVLTIVAIGTGGALGMYLVSTVEKAVDEKQKEEHALLPQPSAYSGNISLRSLGPVVTNLLGSGDEWIRIESSLVFNATMVENNDAIAAEIREDMMSYLRTVELSQIQGASGLQHLREDLNERAVIRSKGLVRELIIESLVVQ